MTASDSSDGALSPKNEARDSSISERAPAFSLSPSPRFLFNSFVDSNMAGAWAGDTFRIFSGKYGEDPVWGDARDLRYADGANTDEAFLRRSDEFIEAALPHNAPAGSPGLHGAVWFETVYPDVRERSGDPLFALYHNENYPATLPYDESTGGGYRRESWPPGLLGEDSVQAVCRIGIMKSVDGGLSWDDRGILLEDLQPRLVLSPVNKNNTFPGGVGDPSAVAEGDYLYVFYGEYGYPGAWDARTHDPSVERSGQCISVARISLSDLDNPEGAARRWDGNAFAARHDGIGTPISALQIPESEGGGAVSAGNKKFYWGPSVSWNTHLSCWVMLMGRVEGGFWVGSSLFISFNPNEALGEGTNSQDWSTPQLMLDRPGHTLWYPSLQPLNTPQDVANRYTSARLGRSARLFFKDTDADASHYLSEHVVEFGLSHSS